MQTGLAAARCARTGVLDGGGERAGGGAVVGWYICCVPRASVAKGGEGGRRAGVGVDDAAARLAAHSMEQRCGDWDAQAAAARAERLQGVEGEEGEALERRMEAARRRLLRRDYGKVMARVDTSA